MKFEGQPFWPFSNRIITVEVTHLLDSPRFDEKAAAFLQYGPAGGILDASKHPIGPEETMQPLPPTDDEIKLALARQELAGLLQQNR